VRAFAGDQLDVIVANAGISEAARIEDHTVADFDTLFATNVRAPLFFFAAAFFRCWERAPA